MGWHPPTDGLRRGILITGIVGLLLLLGATGRAAPAQSDDPLEGPLLAANMCGAGLPGTTHFTFAATGDTFPHENIQAVGEAQGYDYLFDHIRPFLQAADIAYTNFDGAMVADSPYTGYPTFNYNPQLATALKNAGIGVVSTANNHILDRGPHGLDQTLEVLQQAGILQHGAVPGTMRDQPRPAYQPLTLTRDGVSITVGFLSFTWGTNGIPDPADQVNLLWESNVYGQQGNVRQSVLDAIAQARRETDLVIVTTHWGYEYQMYPDQSQIEGARQMAAAGADVILGAQSHTLQPVDLLTTDDGRTTLVAYSLGNFIASQGAFQSPYFSATSVVLYVGIIRLPDGSVRLSGYRYLPMMMTDFDTRPAPVPRVGQDDVIRHVRQKMRDAHGVFQVQPDEVVRGEELRVCPGYALTADPAAAVDGDFAQHMRTLGSGTTPYPSPMALEVFGLPRGPVVQELTGDCAATTSVLYTERQRLEWHPERLWPQRVVGTQLGTMVYRQRYPDAEVARRRDLDGAAIANEPFRQFFQTHGGLAVFGYPISPALEEADPATGQLQMVQYFERARFELGSATDSANEASVRLGLLSQEYGSIAAQCDTAQATEEQVPAPVVSPAPARAAPPPSAPRRAAEPPPAASRGQIPADAGATPWLLGMLGVLLLAATAWVFYRRGVILRAATPVLHEDQLPEPAVLLERLLNELLLEQLLRQQTDDELVQ